MLKNSVEHVGVYGVACRPRPFFLGSVRAFGGLGLFAHNVSRMRWWKYGIR